MSGKKTFSYPAPVRGAVIRKVLLRSNLQNKLIYCFISRCSINHPPIERNPATTTRLFAPCATQLLNVMETLPLLTIMLTPSPCGFPLALPWVPYTHYCAYCSTAAPPFLRLVSHINAKMDTEINCVANNQRPSITDETPPRRPRHYFTTPGHSILLKWLYSSFTNWVCGPPGGLCYWLRCMATSIDKFHQLHYD